MRSCCNFCYDTLSLMQEIGDRELREQLGPIYKALFEAIVTQLGIWASFVPREDINAGPAGCLHAEVHRILLRHVDQILATAQAEVHARAEEYDVSPEEVTDWIQDLIDTVSSAVRRERRHRSS